MIRFAIDPATSEVVRRSAPATDGAGNPRPPVDLDIFKSELSAKGYDPEALIYWLCPGDQFEALRGLTKAQVLATVESGQVVSIEAKPETPALYLVCFITDADGQDPPGLVNDGVDSVIFNAHLEAEDGTLIPVNNFWRIVVRDEDGKLYDQVGITMTDGVAAATYTTTGPPAKGIHLDEIDLNEVPVVVPGLGNCRVVIRENINFKVYRNLS